MKIEYQYIIQCRYNTLNGITPCNEKGYDTIEYKALIAIGKEFIKEKGLSIFSGNFQGDQYFVELWTAHIIFEHGNPDIELKEQCIQIIKKYSDNPLSMKVSIEEQQWLKKHSLI